ncbi:MAG: hypothetical protein PHD66_09280 [Eubacteriales bacterium]|nr:hypothetical protein [Eubacteriales bacterium]
MPSYAIEKKEQTATANEKLQEIAAESVKNTENTLLKAALSQSSENCEKLLKKSNELLEQMKTNLQTDSKQNQELIRELNESVMMIERVNELLNKNIKITISELTSDIRNATVAEVRESLKDINSELQQEAEAIRADAKNIHDFMVSQLNDFEDRKRRFFMFDGAKNVFFWISQAVGILSFGLLVYFLFFKA